MDQSASDQASQSSIDSSDYEDEQAKIEESMVKNAALEAAQREAAKHRKIKIKEVVYKSQEKATISDDVYNLTIAANMTKNVNPESLIYCIRQCVFVFIIQMAIAYYFCYEVRFFENFQEFKTRHTVMRIICSMLI